MWQCCLICCTISLANSLVEKQLRIEQAKFAAAQQRRKELEKGENHLRDKLEQLQKELYLEEQLVSKVRSGCNIRSERNLCFFVLGGEVTSAPFV